MALKNIEWFDIYATTIFNTLYEVFPVCAEMDTMEIVKQECDKRTFRSTLDAEQKGIIFCETMFWLTNNGYIEFREPSYSRPAAPIMIDGFSCITLTLKGLTVMKSPLPEAMRGETIGEEISASFKRDGAFKAAEILTAALMNKALS